MAVASVLGRSRLTAIISAILVAVLAILYEAIPDRDLDWEGTILPLAQSYAGGTNSSEPLRGKIILITGCTSGIGLSLTRAISKLGATVIGLGRNARRLQSLKDEIPTVVTVRADFSDLSSVAQAADAIVERWDHIDILVNNAGMHDLFNNVWGDLESVQGYDRVFSVNYLSHFLLTEKLSGTILNNATKGPTLVQISSMYHWGVDGSDLMVSAAPHDDTTPLAARRGGGSTGITLFRSQLSYSNSKLAQIYHARALRRKHPLWSSSTGARLVSVCPGWVATGIGGTPGGPIAWMMQRSFPVEGWGIASALHVMLDTTIATTTDNGAKEDDYDDFIYSNTQAVSLFRFLFGGSKRTSSPLLPVWLNSSKRTLRNAVSIVLGLIVQRIQKIRCRLGSAPSSPESYNEEIGDALYDWSYQAIKEYL